MNVENRTVFESDNLHILRGLDSETIDLINLDPPIVSRQSAVDITETRGFVAITI